MIVSPIIFTYLQTMCLSIDEWWESSVRKEYKRKKNKLHPKIISFGRMIYNLLEKYWWQKLIIQNELVRKNHGATSEILWKLLHGTE